MKVRIDIDDRALTAARELTGIRGVAALVNVALVALSEREAARRLALLGGSDPSATV